jgi:hypothetical protein
MLLTGAGTESLTGTSLWFNTPVRMPCLQPLFSFTNIIFQLEPGSGVDFGHRLFLPVTTTPLCIVTLGNRIQSPVRRQRDSGDQIST